MPENVLKWPLLGISLSCPAMSSGHIPPRLSGPENFSSLWLDKRYCSSTGEYGEMSEDQSRSGSYIVLRRWIVAFMIIEFLGFVPLLGIFELLPNKLLGQRFWPLVAIMWVALYLLTASCLRWLRCPRCRKNYFGTFSALFGGYVAPGQRYILFSKECANCGLRRDSN